jgi:hypothetical protein
LLIGDLQDFPDGLGRYKLQAQVPSPYINVLCANVKRADLNGLVYEDQVNGKLNSSSDFDATAGSADPSFVVKFNWTNYDTVKSPVDSIFGWNDQNKRPSKFFGIYTHFRLLRYVQFFIGTH